jgi:hypothetical protein
VEHHTRIIHKETAPEQRIAIGRKAEDKVAFRDVALIIRGQEEVLAPLALVGAGIAQVGNLLAAIRHKARV